MSPVPVLSRLSEQFSEIEQLSLKTASWPQVDGTETTLTPSALGATTARVFPFYTPKTLIVNQILVKTPTAQTGAWQFGIFDSTGARVWNSGAVTTTANFTAITAALPITLEGQYYFVVTNNNSAASTTALAVSPALAAASVPRWGTIAVTAGAMPASINPAAITETVGGFPVYTVLSNWTT